MDINVLQSGDIQVVEIVGDIDSKTAALVQEQILPLVTENCKLVLSFSRVVFVSSAGLRVLISLRRHLPPGGSMILVGLSTYIKDTMTTTGFLRFFTTRDSLPEALSVLR